jgi:hypothetical protein
MATYLGDHVADQLSGITPSLGIGLGADVYKIVRVLIPLAHDFQFGLVENGQHFIVISSSPLS